MTEVLVLGGGGIERRKWVVPARESEHGTTLFMSLSESLNACQGVMGKRGTRPRRTWRIRLPLCGRGSVVGERGRLCS